MMFLKTSALLVAFALAIPSVVGCPDSYDINVGSNLNVDYVQNGLRYTCDGLKGWNIWSKVTTPLTPATGATISFDIDVRKIEGTSEVKFALYKDLILRWTHDGTVATWTYYARGFHTIGSSNIVEGSGTHTVSIALSSGGYTVVEDGVHVGDHSKALDIATPTYHMQLLDTGGKLDIYVSEIFRKPGRYSPPQAVWAKAA